MENNQNKNSVLIQDLGMKFATQTSKRKSRYGLYKCFCGREFETRTESTKKYSTKSCGCIRGVNHNLSNHRIYSVWHNMIDRCNNPKCKAYINYGERGIKVCKDWHNVQNFIDDMYPTYQEGLELDRINNDLGYSKDNCRWVARSIQQRNKRKIQTNNKSGYKGVSVSGKKWRASISINKKSIKLGAYITALEAAKAYDNYIIANGLEHTRNFN